MSSTPASETDERPEPALIDCDVHQQPATTDELGVAPQADYAAAAASAYNDWLIDTWLAHSDRFLGSVVVAPQAPEKAATEIRRVGDHPQMVQVLMASANAQGLPYGNRTFWPIYEAAVEQDLPVAVHPGPEGRGTTNPPSGAGYPSTYFEWHSVLPATALGQVPASSPKGSSWSTLPCSSPPSSVASRGCRR